MSVASSRQTTHRGGRLAGRGETLNSRRVPWGIFAGLVVLAGFLCAQLAAVAIISSLTEGFDLIGALSLNWRIGAFYLLSAALTFSLIAVLLKIYRTGWQALGFRRAAWRWMLAAIPVLVASLIIIRLSLALLSFLLPAFDAEQVQILGFDATNRPAELGIIFFSLVLVSPVIEEAVFRGFIFAGLKRRLPIWLATLLSSALFGAVHFQPNVSLVAFVLGLGMVWLYERSGSLWPSTALHALKNMIAFALLFGIGV